MFSRYITFILETSDSSALDVMHWIHQARRHGGKFELTHHDYFVVNEIARHSYWLVSSNLIVSLPRLQHILHSVAGTWFRPFKKVV